MTEIKFEQLFIGDTFQYANYVFTVKHISFSSGKTKDNRELDISGTYINIKGKDIPKPFTFDIKFQKIINTAIANGDKSITIPKLKIKEPYPNWFNKA